MKDHMEVLLEIKEDIGEIKADLKDLRQDHQEIRDYLKTDVKPVVDTYQKYNWLGKKLIWVMGFVALSGSVIAAISRF